MVNCIRAIPGFLMLLQPTVHTAANPHHDWNNEAGYRWAELKIPSNGSTGFTLLSADQTGVLFENMLGEVKAAENRVLLNGSGVAAGDFDQDGLTDLYFCGLESDNVLYRNRGNGRFEDTTAIAGVALQNRFSRGAVFADLNGDRFPDLLVSALDSGITFFRNNGDGSFSNETEFCGLKSGFATTTLALADVDGNGTLDIYATNNRGEDIRDRGRVNLRRVKGELVIPNRWKNRLVMVDGKLKEYGEPDQLFLNDGMGHFKEVDWTQGSFLDEKGRRLTSNPLDWGLTATFRDFNRDLLPDIYVCNDFWTPDRLWINQGGGVFQAASKLALRHTSASSMGVDVADIDLDGRMDFFVVDMLSRDLKTRKRQMPAQGQKPKMPGSITDRPQILRNTLYRNLGNGMFQELADYAGLPASDWSWSPVFLDVDLDGYEDLLITAGHPMDVQDMDAQQAIQKLQHTWDPEMSPADRRKGQAEEILVNNRLYPKLDLPVVAFRNMGNWTFKEMTPDWGTAHSGVHHGMATFDLDGDGDLDFAVNNLGSEAGIYRNNSRAPRIAVRLKGASLETQGIGARVEFHDESGAVQTREVVSGGRYTSGSDPILVFAAVAGDRPMKLNVAWRDGSITELKSLFANRIYEIDHPGSAAYKVTSAKEESIAQTPWFEDISQQVVFTHQETLINDFALQPLLPFHLSQAGPGLASVDWNGDGRDDLIVGNGKGFPPVFLQSEPGGFRRLKTNIKVLPDDGSGIVAFRTESSGYQILIGTTGYESSGHGSVVHLRIEENQVEELASGFPGLTGAGALAVADYDADGDLDLFTGGYFRPGVYPLVQASVLWKREKGEWGRDEQNESVLRGVQSASGALWSDLDGNGYPELIIAEDWGPIRVFTNHGGRLTEGTASWGLDKLNGWWKGIATGDFNGDGRMDLVAGNWGLNSPYQAAKEAPLELLYGDLMRVGKINLIETERDPITAQVFPRRMFQPLAASLSFLYPSFKGYAEFSEKPLAKLMEDYQPRLQTKSIVTLATTIFLNSGSRLTARTLPWQAQLAPVSGINAADFDGDGHQDLFLAQNFFATRPGLPRLDAGSGLILKGDGKGGFKPMESQVTGIRIFGEQRGSVTGDFNGDGRIDLAVAQNGAGLKIYRNTKAKPGIRIRITGLPGNPDGIGTSIQQVSGNKAGTLHEIQSGSGYWSQSSLSTILYNSHTSTKLQIRQPGGKVTQHSLPPESKQLILDISKN
ncbi:MAG TPA: hypothetical protein EYG38_08270 [Verrucomicrobia bacterium]|nr:hypothetical protein [Verrucomicrobiota bacterium]